MKHLIYAQKSDNDILTDYEVVKEFRTHNILRERIDIYRDFTINLIHYLYDTYLGNEYIKSEKDIRGHFSWCFMKVLDEFYKEELDFIDNEQLYNYFFNFYMVQFYKTGNHNTINYYINFWEDIFNYKVNKKKKYLDVLVEIYNVFNVSLEKKERSLELV